MCDTTLLDPKTVIIRADTEEELSEIIDLVSGKDRAKNLQALIDFAASHRKVVKNYKFNREECYEE